VSCFYLHAPCSVLPQRASFCPTSTTWQAYINTHKHQYTHEDARPKTRPKTRHAHSNKHTYTPDSVLPTDTHWHIQTSTHTHTHLQYAIFCDHNLRRLGRFQPQVSDTTPPFRHFLHPPTCTGGRPKQQRWWMALDRRTFTTCIFRADNGTHRPSKTTLYAVSLRLCRPVIPSLCQIMLTRHPKTTSCQHKLVMTHQLSVECPFTPSQNHSCPEKPH